MHSKTNFQKQNKTLQMLISEFLKGRASAKAADLQAPQCRCSLFIKSSYTFISLFSKNNSTTKNKSKSLDLPFA
jgi:hypothetical protein